MEIKKCSCGGIAFMETEIDGAIADTTIRCLKCGKSIRVRNAFNEYSIAEAIKCWNKRVGEVNAFNRC